MILRVDNDIKKEQNYSLLDLFKVIMALLVVTIHRRIGSSDVCLINLEVNTLARFAVPFFFTCSSFLFFHRNYKLEYSKLINFVKKNLRMYITWYILLFPQTIFRYLYRFNMSAKEIIYSLIINNFDNPLHLWFLPSLALSVAIIFVLVKKSERLSFILSVTSIIFSIIFTFKNFSFNNSYVSFLVRTMFIGIPYVYIGFFLSKHKINISKSKTILFLSLSIIASFIWGYIEFIFDSKILFYEYKITNIPVIIFLMILGINYSPQKNFIKLRKASMLIYYLHIAIYQEILYIILDLLGFGFLIQNSLAILFITLAYTILFTVIILLMENKKGFHWLKKLYN